LTKRTNSSTNNNNNINNNINNYINNNYNRYQYQELALDESQAADRIQGTSSTRTSAATRDRPIHTKFSFEFIQLVYRYFFPRGAAHTRDGAFEPASLALSMF